MPDKVLNLVTGKDANCNPDEAWDLIRNPLPPRSADALFDMIRGDLGVADRDHFTSRPRYELADFTTQKLEDELTETRGGLTFFQRNNPIVRHTVL